MVAHIVRHEMLDRDLGAASDNMAYSSIQAQSLKLNEQLELSNTVSTVQIPTIAQEQLHAHHQTNNRFPDPALAIKCMPDQCSDVEAIEGQTSS